MTNLIEILGALVSVVAILFSTITGPDDGATKFTLSSVLVSQLSDKNETFQGSDFSEYLADIEVTSIAETGGKKSFVMRKKNVGSITVFCEKEGQCTATKSELSR